MDRHLNGSDNGSGQDSAGTSRWKSAFRRATRFFSPPGIPAWKRGLDLGLILLCSPALVPACAVVALLIRFGSKGPLFFTQPRVGHKGRQFVCFKFRTMRAGAETQSHKNYTQQLIRSQNPMHKLDNRKDPRLIPFGRWLRAGGLDELPQLLNVLRGEMSLVGPRPCIPYEYEMYEPWHCQRLDVVPGLTGLWQVSGKNRTTFEQMVKLDIEYSLRQNLWLDVRILVRTMPAIWTQYRDLRAARRERRQASAPPARRERQQVSSPPLRKSVPTLRYES